MVPRQPTAEGAVFYTFVSLTVHILEMFQWILRAQLILLKALSNPSIRFCMRVFLGKILTSFKAIPFYTFSFQTPPIENLDSNGTIGLSRWIP